MQGRKLWRRFLDDSGQDLIEYALLASIIAAAGVLIMPSIQAGMGQAFGDWGDAVYDLWEPDTPAAAAGS
jgi:Flp pilus assembly pilin Flp